MEPKSSTSAISRTLARGALALLLSAIPLAAAEGEYGGTPSTKISGNTILDLYYSPADTAIFALTSQGLSYARARIPLGQPARFFNFGSDLLPSGAYPVAVAASDTALFMTAYYLKDGNYFGGLLLWKRKGETAFTAYDPAFRSDPDNDEQNRSPWSIALSDSQIFVSLYTGALLRNRLPPAPADWRVVLLNPATLQDMIASDTAVIGALNRVRDSLLALRPLVMDDTVRIRRTDSLFRRSPLLRGDSLAALPADSFKLVFESFRFSIDTSAAPDTAVFKRNRTLYRRPLASLAALLDSVADSVIPASVRAISTYIDTLRLRYDSLVTEVAPAAYPPDDYHGIAYTHPVNSIATQGGLLFVGNWDGLLVSADQGKTFKGKDGELLTRPGGLFHRNGRDYQTILNIAVQRRAGNAFRLFALGDGDTLGCSAVLPDASVDSATRLPRHLDSLARWTHVPTEAGMADIAFFNDTCFVAYGLHSANGLRKYYEIDTVRMTGAETVSVREWRFTPVTLDGFLEPQLGLASIEAVPLDSARYDLWSGTQDGLYRLAAGASQWEHYEYLKPLPNTSETFAFPTVIMPGFKSARIAYSLDRDARVTIDIFDFSMRKVRTLVRNAPRTKGTRSDVGADDRWDGRDDNGRAAAPGVYYYKIAAGSKALFGKIVVFGAKDY